jgi:hypothetical protein
MGASGASRASVDRSEQLACKSACAGPCTIAAEPYAAASATSSAGPSAAAARPPTGPPAAQPRLRPSGVPLLAHPAEPTIVYPNVTKQRKLMLKFSNDE